jgi:hypothetical protein
MADDEEEDNDMTLWSASIFETLYLVLRKNLPDAKLQMALQDVIDKGHKPSAIIEKVREKVGATSAARVKKVIDTMRK